MKFFFGLILILILTYLLNKIFLFNRTIYTLLYAVIVFISISCYFIYLGFEFLGLSFFITYVGGIAVMFLFLIVVSDVKHENSKEIKKFMSKKDLYIVFLIFFCVIFFSLGFLLAYDFALFNDYEFKVFVLNDFSREHIEKLFRWYWRSFDNEYDFKVFYINKITDLFNGVGNITFYNWYNSHIFYSDIFILGSFIYKEHYLFVIVISFFLFVAIVLACSISSMKVVSAAKDEIKELKNTPRIYSNIPFILIGAYLDDVYTCLFVSGFVLISFCIVTVLIVLMKKPSYIRYTVACFLLILNILSIACFSFCIIHNNHFFIFHYNILGVSLIFKYHASFRFANVLLLALPLFFFYFNGYWPESYTKNTKLYSLLWIAFTFVLVLIQVNPTLALDYNTLYDNFILVISTKK